MATASQNAERVIPFNNAANPRSPGFRILSECRDRFSAKLTEWLKNAAPKVAEELFVLADSTRDRLAQTRYLDIRGALDTMWPMLIEAFRRNLSTAGDKTLSKETAQPSTIAQLDVPDFDGLKLVEDEELSENIVIREFSAQLEETCNEELYALERRVAVLTGIENMSETSHPFAPACVCDALFQACVSATSERENGLILVRRLERQLHKVLPDIYATINAQLVDRRILPDLKRSFARQSTITGQTSETPTNPAIIGSTQAVASAPPIDANNIATILQRLAASRQGLSPSPATAPLAAGDTNAASLASLSFPPQQEGTNTHFIASLNSLQHDFVAENFAHTLPTNQIRVLRDSSASKDINSIGTVTIDIVATLFDFILDDKNVPLAVKALLSRLQIPVLKVAMINPGFFGDRQHPTRNFMRSIAGVAMRWGESVDENDPFYKKLSSVIERIQTEFESNIEIFNEALAELEAFVKENEGNEIKTAKAAAAVVVKREKEADAQDEANRLLNAVLADTSIANEVADCIRKTWQPLLTQAIYTNDSARIAAEKSTLDDLIWSISAKKGPEDRLKLISMLPPLLRKINQTLDASQINSDERTRFLDALMKRHAAALKGITEFSQTAPATPISPAATSDTHEDEIAVTHSQNAGVNIEEITLAAHATWLPDEQEIAREVHGLTRGTWVEFRDELGVCARERLNWISPQRGILLFSNHRASKAISITPEALTRQISLGKAKIIKANEVFDSALIGAIDALRAESS